MIDESPNKLPASEKKNQAARMVAQGCKNKQISADLQISPRCLAYWKKDEEFNRMLEAHLNSIEQAVYRSGIADRRRLLHEIAMVFQKLQTIREARANEPNMHTVPGGDTGLLIKKVKSIMTSDGPKTYVEYVLDGRLLKGLQHALEMMARATGLFKQMPERRIVRLNDLSREEVDALMLDISKTHGIPLPPEEQPGGKADPGKRVVPTAMVDTLAPEAKVDCQPTVRESLDPAA